MTNYIKRKKIIIILTICLLIGNSTFLLFGNDLKIDEGKEYLYKSEDSEELKIEDKEELDKSKINELFNEIYKLEIEKNILNIRSIRNKFDEVTSIMTNEDLTQEEIDREYYSLKLMVDRYKKNPDFYEDDLIIEDNKDSEDAQDIYKNQYEYDSNYKPKEFFDLLSWPQFMGNYNMQGISDAKVPRNSKELKEYWRYSESKHREDWAKTPGTPIIVGDYTYCYINEKLMKFNTITGDIIKTADAPGDPMFFINIAYGDGKIFVPRYNQKERKTYIIAYDADTLEQLFITSSFGNGSQVQAYLFYNDGMIYTGVREFNGKFVAFQTKDKDPGKSNEVVYPAWEIETGSTLGIGTNMGPSFIGDSCIFGDQGIHGKRGSIIRVVNRKTGDLKQSFELTKDESISSAIIYYEKNNRVYIASTDYNKGMILRSFFVNRDGTLNLESMKKYVSDVENGGTQSSPVIYNDRLYIAGGGRTMGSAEPFRVMDANTLEEIYRIDEIKTKGTPVISTGYASVENNHEIYIHLIPYAPDESSNSSLMYIIKDSKGQMKPKYEKITNVGDKEYASQTMSISKTGHLLFYNDAKILYSFGKKDNYNYKGRDLYKQIERLGDPKKFGYFNKSEIYRIIQRYRELPSNEKEKVSNYDKIKDILRIISLTPEDYLNKGIQTLPGNVDELSEDDISKIIYLKSRLDLVENKERIKNKEKLEKLYSKIDDITKINKVNIVIKNIDNLNQNIKFSDRVKIESIRYNYDMLDHNLKSNVYNINKLKNAEAELRIIENTLKNIDLLVNEHIKLKKIDEHYIEIFKMIDDEIEKIDSKDLDYINSYTQYYIPAKIDYVNLMIDKILSGKSEKIYRDIDNINYILKSISDVDKRYIDKYDDFLKYTKYNSKKLKVLSPNNKIKYQLANKTEKMPLSSKNNQINNNFFEEKKSSAKKLKKLKKDKGEKNNNIIKAKSKPIQEDTNLRDKVIERGKEKTFAPTIIATIFGIFILIISYEDNSKLRDGDYK